MTPEGGAGHSIKLEYAVAEEAAKYPERPVEVLANDEHPLGLKPVTRRVWAPIGERPVAHGHHRFDWLYVTAFVSPATGETFWYVHDGASKPAFAALLESFAREAGAGVDRTIVLVLDNARWHGEAGPKVPDGVRLVFLPPYSPELRPAETLKTLVDEPSSTSTSKQSKISPKSSATGAQPSQITATLSKAEPASIGGPKSPTQSNQPESV